MLQKPFSYNVFVNFQWWKTEHIIHSNCKNMTNSIIKIMIDVGKIKQCICTWVKHVQALD